MLPISGISLLLRVKLEIFPQRRHSSAFLGLTFDNIEVEFINDCEELITPSSDILFG